MAEQEPTIQTPEWFQDNLKIILNVPKSGNADYSFEYILGGCPIIGNSGIYISNTYLKWDYFLPKGEDEDMQVASRAGYGTLAHTLPLICLVDLLGKNTIGSMKVGHDHEPSNSRIGLLKNIGIYANSRELIPFGEYIAASLEACKRKGFQLNTFSKVKLPNNPYFDSWEYSFPFSDMNLLGCQQCFLHGSECRLNKVMNVKDLLGVLNSPEGAEVSKISTRLTRPLMGLTHRSTIDGRGKHTTALCVDNMTDKLTGEYPNSQSQGIVRDNPAKDLVRRLLKLF